MSVGEFKHTKETDPGFTFFAPAKRLDPEVIEEQVRRVCDNALFNSCLNAFGGIVVLINSFRQIIGANIAFLQFIGIQDPQSLLGLRPGEALRCIHVEKAPNGCGTGRLCRDCGAAIAIVASQAKKQKVSRECLMTTGGNGIENAYEFRVCASPITLCEEAFILITMQDIRKEKKFEVMERVFLHDLANIITALYSNALLVQRAVPQGHKQYADELTTLVGILENELSAQRDLIAMESGTFATEANETSVSAIFTDLETQFRAIGNDESKLIEFSKAPNDPKFTVSSPLLHRVLENMLKNALEATSENSPVRLYCEERDDSITFCVRNRGTIPEDVARRIFQRHFTTKQGAGHGLGTYSMKLIGERYLNGRVSFRSSPEEGTVFSIEIPR